ncbi:PIN domain-containing protein [Rhizobium herbae]|jgi:tRNA(fMet)-specific endonuclease VapC
MRYLLDTNAFIALIGQKSERLVTRTIACDVGAIGLSTVVLHELYYGAYRSQRVEFNLESLRLLTRDFPLVAFDRDDAQVAGDIRARLAAFGTPIGSFDILIAAQAKAKGLICVTNNMREFQRVEGLNVEDWTVAD